MGLGYQEESVSRNFRNSLGHLSMKGTSGWHQRSDSRGTDHHEWRSRLGTSGSQEFLEKLATKRPSSHRLMEPEGHQVKLTRYS